MYYIKYSLFNVWCKGWLKRERGAPPSPDNSPVGVPVFTGVKAEPEQSWDKED